MSGPNDAELRERLRVCLPMPSDGSKMFVDEIAAVASVIFERFAPWQTVLYGSRAYGVPTEESDADFLVVMDTLVGTGKQTSIISAALPGPHELTLSIQVRAPDQIAIGLAEGDFYVRDIMRKGIILHEQLGASQSMHDDLEWVSRFTMDVCYPNPPVTDFNPQRALSIAAKLRTLARTMLGAR